MPGLMSSMAFPSDTDAFQLSLHCPIVIINPSHVDGRHHRGQYANAEGDREPFDRTRAELKKNQSGKKCGYVGIDDRRHSVLKPSLNRRARCSPGSYFFTNTL